MDRELTLYSREGGTEDEAEIWVFDARSFVVCVLGDSCRPSPITSGGSSAQGEEDRYGDLGHRGLVFCHAARTDVIFNEKPVSEAEMPSVFIKKVNRQL